MKRKLLISAALLIAAIVLPDVLTAQPLPGGGPGGGIAGAPIDPASWLIPAGVAAYYKYKQHKKAKQESKDSEG
jgi:hypothetical protein